MKLLLLLASLFYLLKFTEAVTFYDRLRGKSVSIYPVGGECHEVGIDATKILHLMSVCSVPGSMKFTKREIRILACAASRASKSTRNKISSMTTTLQSLSLDDHTKILYVTNLKITKDAFKDMVEKAASDKFSFRCFSYSANAKGCAISAVSKIGFDLQSISEVRGIAQASAASFKEFLDLFPEFIQEEDHEMDLAIRFARWWTRYEARAKLSGLGLFHTMQQDKHNCIFKTLFVNDDIVMTICQREEGRECEIQSNPPSLPL